MVIIDKVQAVGSAEGPRYHHAGEKGGAGICVGMDARGGSHSAYDRSPLWMFMVYPLAISEAMPFVTAMEGLSSRPGSLEPSAWACEAHQKTHHCPEQIFLLTQESLRRSEARIARRSRFIMERLGAVRNRQGGSDCTCPISADMMICRQHGPAQKSRERSSKGQL